MKSKDQTKTSAVKLRELLHETGIELKHSESLEVISKLEGYPDWNTHTAYITRREQIAEQYLDELLEGLAEKDYAKVSRHMDEEESKDFTEKEFLRMHSDLLEDLGPYVSREYLGSISGESKVEPQQEYPEGVRHVWRGVFEKHQVFIHVGIYQKNGTHYIAEAKIR